MDQLFTPESLLQDFCRTEDSLPINKLLKITREHHLPFFENTEIPKEILDSLLRLTPLIVLKDPRFRTKVSSQDLFLALVRDQRNDEAAKIHLEMPFTIQHWKMLAQHGGTYYFHSLISERRLPIQDFDMLFPTLNLKEIYFYISQLPVEMKNDHLDRMINLSFRKHKTKLLTLFRGLLRSANKPFVKASIEYLREGD